MFATPVVEADGVNVCTVQDSWEEGGASRGLGQFFQCLQERRDRSAGCSKGKEDYKGINGFDYWLHKVVIKIVLVVSFQKLNN